MLSIIIPQFNKARMTENTIDSIVENSKDLEYEIILVDNGSGDRISEEHKKKVKYVRLDTNLFFAGGCNAGAAVAIGEDLCFMNNDILLSPGWWSGLTILNTIPNAGLVGVKLKYPTEAIQHAGIRFFRTNDERLVCPDHCYRFWPQSSPEANTMRIMQAVTGAVFFIKKLDFDALGGLDMAYINNYEDIDLCFKVRFNLKKNVIYWPGVDIVHLETQTPRDNTNTAFMANHMLFMDRWSNFIDIDGDPDKMLRMR